MDAMRSFSLQRENDAIPLANWIEARDTMATSIRLLDVPSRPSFMQILMDALLPKNPKNVPFITFLGSIISISRGDDINGNVEVNSSARFCFKVLGKDPMTCKKSNVCTVFFKHCRFNPSPKTSTS